ncbi:MAG TPA: hypothetical protein VFJ62_04020 [Usitatibacter sp.]|nr:hypothetical protein [Usitatibacter sp.]
MKARSAVLAVIGSGVLLGVLLEAVTLGVRTATAPSRSADMSRPQPAPVTTVTPAGAATRSSTTTALPAHAMLLPPPNTPLGPLMPALREAGMHGDGAAACRYAMETMRCGQHWSDVDSEKSMRRFLEREKGMPSAQREQIDRVMTEMRARIARDAPVCRGVSPEERTDAWRVLFAAARDGHLPSMARFATTEFMFNGRVRNEYDEEALSAYRTYGLRFLEAAAREGDVAAIEKLGREYLEPGRGTRAVPYDPARGIAYLTALAAHAAPAYRQELSHQVDDAVSTQGIRAEDVRAGEALAATILPTWRRDDYTKPRFEPESGFGCERGP